MRTTKNDLIIDTYNANPTSMKTSLDFFISIPSSMPKMAILGEMKELGEISESEHKRMITYLSDNPNMEIYLVGQIFNNMIVPDNKYKFFESVVELKAFLEINPIKGYYIFIKGSHSVQLDTVIEFL
jgi:UDP-N-acetylmuramoyl-tripeptide--D-alanyl-D-alanine ligase